VDRRYNIVKIPNAALRFYPSPQHVRPADLPILEGKLEAIEDTAERGAAGDSSGSAEDRSRRQTQRHRRHVWVTEGAFLRAVEVTTGLSDSSLTEMSDGPLKEGDALVTGIRPAAFVRTR
jgi:HlyD family secretion protein